MSAVVPLPRIHALAAEVADQIAAGEVIERPASVVKELVENSIDASATRISIDVAGAGIKLIRVHDNGQGIHQDDLVLALQSHATSKLTSAGDLSQIASLGFRGEALPSIASVSRFQLISRQRHSNHAWSVDNALEIKPAAHSDGTTVEVRDLFHATPARRKFLKSERTEWLQIQALIKAIALGHCNIAFQLKYDDQPQLNYASCAGMPEQRVAAVCGKALLQHSVLVDGERDGMHVQGWMGLNEVARSQTDRQYFFVNGRLVQDKHVNHALRLAYSDRIDRGRYPSYVLFLQLDPAVVDINVHPAKSEVRFAEPRNVHDFIYAAISNALSNNCRPEFFGKTESRVTTRPTEVVNDTTGLYQHRHLQHDLLQQASGKQSYLSLGDGQYVIVDTGSEQLLIDVADTHLLLTLHELIGARHNGNIEQRPVQVAVSCNLSLKQQLVIQEQQDVIASWGFSIEPIAPEQVSIRAIPAILPYADIVPLVTDFLKSLCANEPDEQMAARLAEHVNDAGFDINTDSIDRLINSIKQYEQQTASVKSVPWRRLDPAALASLMDT